MRWLLLLTISSFSISVFANEAYTPKTNDTIIMQLPPLNLQDKKLQQTRQLWQQHPKQITPALSLARLYLQQAQNQQSTRYLGYAQAVLTPWDNLDNPPVELRYLRARLSQTQHKFGNAIIELEKILAQQKNNTSAWLTLASVYEAKGLYKKGLNTCKGLGNTGNTLLQGLCVGNFWILTNQPTKGFALLTALLPQVPASDLRVWLLTVLAEAHWLNGTSTLAENYFKQGLKLAPNNQYLLKAYADFLLKQQRPLAVISLLSQSTLDARLLLRIAFAQQLLHQNDLLKVSATRLRMSFSEARHRGSNESALDEARFTLLIEQNTNKALILALSHWQSEKSIHTAHLITQMATETENAVAISKIKRWVAAEQITDKKLLRLLTRSLSENRKPTAKKLDLATFPPNYRQIYLYSPQISEKSGSNQLSLATVPVLGQAPSAKNKRLL